MLYECLSAVCYSVPICIMHVCACAVCVFLEVIIQLHCLCIHPRPCTDDNEIICFSHTHMMGAGVEDYGTIGIMPVREVSDKTVENYRSSFSHKTEYAIPGYYTVQLDSPHVKAELTVAGNWTGVHKYSFEGDGARYIIVDALHAVQKVSSSVCTVRETHTRAHAVHFTIDLD